ncbi:hypothetical protein RRF68_00850 [Tenacibaculum sp. HL-MS23]|uniref:hypothetical protein n=1 Tax=Tenacibaculum TaxID=104267 RepID=UPI001C4F355A|nr:MULTISPECIES: hypothetical protein [Tenacibaculum]QXP74191.1 hypothetical protein H0I30_03330 [Tenacibaculum sp. AHE14PA]QXP75441.1 hypothetical protein H0I31_09650 [Tenacibaculum sp. AHE15PA]WNW01994.1 hypothetical protein RRF68_00850 [Tenacibaculum sp. HL-MS23]
MQTYKLPKDHNFQFTVNKKQVNKNKTLKTSILYHKIEATVTSSLNLHQPASSISFKSIEFDFIKNAFLNDKLIIHNYIKKLSDSEVILHITVSKKAEKERNIICKAVFGYNFLNGS